ncbi:hypothetical protein D9Q98_003843 [Chlorella vulgaris]|uniref:Uncharacterized protein n=1 Tax=Chlorella vulgaris TaxID=3077 RepID=A0A9D4TQK2_CHLVU|nr:hypothetical protein D9Q98_003843 [Chlorella vulgaris]
MSCRSQRPFSHLQGAAAGPRLGWRQPSPHRRLLPLEVRRSFTLPHTLPDGAAGAVHPGYVTDTVPSDPAPAAAAPRRQRPQQELPPLVDSLLSSPSLERPEGTDPKQLLRVMEAFWAAMKDGKAVPAPSVVKRQPGTRLPSAPQYDVAVAGGTLGILLATALQARGHRVAVIERRRLEGRLQEWNIGRGELGRLVACGVLTQQEVDACVTSQFGPVRVAFKGSPSLDCGPDVLNCGVSPRLLIETLRRKFLEAGGELLEETAFKSAAVLDDGVHVELLPGRQAAPGMQPGDVNRPMAMAAASAAAAAGRPGTGSSSSSTSTSSSRSSSGGHSPHSPRRSITARLLVDCMGHYSPIAKQLRGGQRPDGVVLVVGGAWLGFSPERNTAADLLHTFTDSADDQQLFWEAFPAAGGQARTLYMFQYSDAHPSRPSFTQLLDTYLRLLPQYQGVPLEQLQPQRILMGGFPCYESGPLQPGWDRVLQVGDAAGAQSPLSFGGFGSLVRHMPRLVAGVSEALQEERLARRDLAWLAPYQPSLSTAFLLQRAMAPRPGQVVKAPASKTSSTPKSASKQAVTQHAAGSSGGPAAPSSQGAGEGRGWLPANHVNRLLRTNFSVLRLLGEGAMRPFLQDTLRFWPLAATMLGMLLRDPICICRVLVQLGPLLLLRWTGHFLALAAYTLGHTLLSPLRPLLGARSWRFRRLLDALEWGSGAS